MNVFYNPCDFQLSKVQGKLFPVWSPASGHAIFATDFSDSLLKCMANDRYAFVRAIDSLPCLAFGVGKRDRITTCNISLDRYLKKEINWREKKFRIDAKNFGGAYKREICAKNLVFRNRIKRCYKFSILTISFMKLYAVDNFWHFLCSKLDKGWKMKKFSRFYDEHYSRIFELFTYSKVTSYYYIIDIITQWFSWFL